MESGGTPKPALGLAYLRQGITLPWTGTGHVQSLQGRRPPSVTSVTVVGMVQASRAVVVVCRLAAAMALMWARNSELLLILLLIGGKD